MIKLLGALLLLVLAMAAAGAVTMSIWNGLITDIFSLREISFWEALAIFGLCRLLFTTTESSRES